MTYRVRLTREAEADLIRLFDFVLERELASPTGDLELAERALEAIREGFRRLEHYPFVHRTVGAGPFVRELSIPFGHTGYVALFEIVDAATIVIGAVRHQLEEDYD